jgi:glycosyltransferase involved in cell wall biosynthesis
MAKRNILFIRRTPVNKFSGIANYCRALRELFYDDEDLHPLEIEDIPSIHSFLFHFYYRLFPLVRTIQCADIIHINGYTEMGAVEALAVAKILKKTTVYTAHWHPFKHLRHPYGGWVFFQLFMRPAIKFFADTVITINNEDTTFFSSFHHHVVQIPHWLQTHAITTGKTRDPRMVLFVGRLNDPMKGFEHLQHLPKGCYDIHIIGNGNKPLRSDMSQHCNIPNNKLEELYSKASLLVVPSKYEAFSYVALEALQHGTPVLLSNRVRIADYLCGIPGVNIFPYGNYEAFCESVTKVIGTSVDTTTISKIFNPERIKDIYKKVYLRQI